ncbi:glycerol-3-phosphate dehydrogenase/oxidase [Rhodoluna sp. KAS3]|uniref:glycerol-3-phosphate dehydrogenase/oxidase n=1 Tax=Rhodoluna sp. KAS3 TaxID=942880 RepID=UPI00222E8E99|nr:glycerol-3-phosphate dehydrogenase/oxidase [Rhodoluna sp. KAS3]BDS49442.1 glycerol-3-phosphate dehydrogenase [Rhodoluna sp. KAS3]
MRPNVSALMADNHAQVLIIGGGINGLATFRDLSLQGVKVALVERNDFASGASAASSHMIHGGIRYLENGEFRLVRESVTERNGLLKIAPHYVKPLQTTIPIFTTYSGILAAPMRFLTHKQNKPTQRGALLIKLGLSIYDSFSSGGGTVPPHKFLGRKKSLQELPALDPNVKYTATYFDASVHEPERLALDVLLDGLSEGSNARAVNYVEAVGVVNNSVLLKDRETGQAFEFKADLVINASGPWTDLTNQALGEKSQFMGGTKGSHIVLDHPELLAACDGRELFFENADGRIVLIYPLKGRVLVGTSDLEADINEPAVCTEEEIDYFFGLIGQVFPRIAVDRSQIVYKYSGVRPLPRHEDTAPGFVSRDYRIVEGLLPGTETPLLSLVGGKWTTFRALAEHLSKEALAALGLDRRVSTKNLAIGGAKDFPKNDKARDVWLAEHATFVGQDRALQLLERYGTRAAKVIEFLSAVGDSPFKSTDKLSTGELRYIVEKEMAVHLVDILMRRTSLAFTGEATDAVITEVATEMQQLLGWSEPRTQAEITKAQRSLS